MKAEFHNGRLYVRLDHFEKMIPTYDKVVHQRAYVDCLSKLEGTAACYEHGVYWLAIPGFMTSENLPPFEKVLEELVRCGYTLDELSEFKKVQNGDNVYMFLDTPWDLIPISREMGRWAHKGTVFSPPSIITKDLLLDRLGIEPYIPLTDKELKTEINNLQEVISALQSRLNT